MAGIGKRIADRVDIYDLANERASRLGDFRPGEVGKIMDRGPEILRRDTQGEISGNRSKNVSPVKSRAGRLEMVNFVGKLDDPGYLFLFQGEAEYTIVRPDEEAALRLNQ